MKDGAKVTKILRFNDKDDSPKNSEKQFWPDDAGAACLDYQGPPPCPYKNKRSAVAGQFWES